jgi:hypothetical protein
MNILAIVLLWLILLSWVLLGYVCVRWIVEKLRELKNGTKVFNM